MGSWRNLLCTAQKPLRNVLGFLVFFDLNIFHLLSPLFWSCTTLASSSSSSSSYAAAALASPSLLFRIDTKFRFSLSHFDRLKAPWHGGQPSLPLAFSRWSNLSKPPFSLSSSPFISLLDPKLITFPITFPPQVSFSPSLLRLRLLLCPASCHSKRSIRTPPSPVHSCLRPD